MSDESPDSVQDLELHLLDLLDNPDAPLDEELVHAVELELTHDEPPPFTAALLPILVRTLSTYQGDPTCLGMLAIGLIRLIPFSQAFTLASEHAVIRALRSPPPIAVLVALTIVGTASKCPNEAALLSVVKRLVEQVVLTWLSNPNIGIGESATVALGDVFDTDSPKRAINFRLLDMTERSDTAPGLGLFWRRMLRDVDIYEMILKLCSWSDEDRSDQNQPSLAQGRLLRLMPRLAVLDFHAVSHTNFPDLERKYGMEEGERGLLHFAIKMVDKEDRLMHLTLINFFDVLLHRLSKTEMTSASMAYLAWLVARSLHSDAELFDSLVRRARAEPYREIRNLMAKLVNYEADLKDLWVL